MSQDHNSNPSFLRSRGLAVPYCIRSFNPMSTFACRFCSFTWCANEAVVFGYGFCTSCAAAINIAVARYSRCCRGEVIGDDVVYHKSRPVGTENCFDARHGSKRCTQLSLRNVSNNAQAPYSINRHLEARTIHEADVHAVHVHPYLYIMSHGPTTLSVYHSDDTPIFLESLTWKYIPIVFPWTAISHV